jgi:ribosomal protein S14
MVIQELVLGQMVNELDKADHGKDIRGEKHPMSKLTACQVLDIRCDNRPKAVIARSYGVSRACIRKIKNNTSWSWL